VLLVGATDIKRGERERVGVTAVGRVHCCIIEMGYGRFSKKYNDR
jgi:hypothetical protein